MSKMPFTLAISGVKNSGKTTLIEKLIPILNASGLKTAVIKHDGHSFTPDTPGTDSYRFFAAGALGTAIYDSEKASLSLRIPMDETKLAGFFPDADLILLEGFKDSRYRKIELVRKGVSEKPVCDSETVVAFVSGLDLETALPVFHPDATEEIADFINTQVRREAHDEG